MIRVQVHASALKRGLSAEEVIRMWSEGVEEEIMTDKIAKPIDGSYGVIDGLQITEEVVSRLIENAEQGFPGAKFRAPGRPARTASPTRAVTVRLSDSELEAVMLRAQREHLTRSDAIRVAIAEWVRAS